MHKCINFLKFEKLVITKTNLDLLLSLHSSECRFYLHKNFGTDLENFFKLLSNYQELECYFFTALHQKNLNDKEAYTLTINFFNDLKKEELKFFIKEKYNEQSGDLGKWMEPLELERANKFYFDLPTLEILADAGQIPVSLYYAYYNMHTFLLYLWVYQVEESGAPEGAPDGHMLHPSDIKFNEKNLLNDKIKLFLKHEYGTVEYLEKGEHLKIGKPLT